MFKKLISKFKEKKALVKTKFSEKLFSKKKSIVKSKIKSPALAHHYNPKAPKTVMVFGTFSILHPGHLYLLRQAKNYGTNLIVVVARDSNVKKFKGKLLVSEKDRMRVLEAMPAVSKVVLGNPHDPLEVIRKYTPDCICLGYDQVHFMKELEHFNLVAKHPIPVVRLSAYKPHIYKSSKLAKKLEKLM